MINPGDIMIKFTAPEELLIKVTDNLDEVAIKILELISIDPAYTTTYIAHTLSTSRKTV